MYYKMELNSLASGRFWEWMGRIAITVVWPPVRFSVISTNTLIVTISINTPTSYMCCVGLVHCMGSLVLATIYGDEATGLSGDSLLVFSFIIGLYDLQEISTRVIQHGPQNIPRPVTGLALSPPHFMQGSEFWRG